MKLNYQHSSQPPRKPRGKIIQTLKEVFFILDEYPSKSPYQINWFYFWMDHDWCWVSPRVFDSLKKDKMLYRNFQNWEANLAEVMTLSKKARLVGSPVQESYTSILLPNFNQTLEVQIGDHPMTSGVKTLMGQLRKIDYSQYEALPKKSSVRFHLIEDSGSWVINYAEGIVEINTVSFSSLNKGLKSQVLLIGLGLGVLSNMRPVQRNAWYRFSKKNRRRLGRYERRVHPEVVRNYVQFGVGLVDVAKNTEDKYYFDRFFTLTSAVFPEPDDDATDYLELTDVMRNTLEEATDNTNTELDGTPFSGISMKEMADITGITAVSDSGMMSEFTEDEEILHLAMSDRRNTVMSVETGSDRGNDSDWGSGESKFRMARTLIYDRQTQISTLANDVFLLGEDFRGMNIGVQMMGGQIEFCLNRGIDRIQCSAAREDGVFVGYKVWHKMGYDGEITLKKVLTRDPMFYTWVEQSNKNKLDRYPLEEAQDYLNNLMMAVVNQGKTKITRMMPNAYMMDVDDRYKDIRFGGDQATKPDFKDIFRKFSKSDIITVIENVSRRLDPLEDYMKFFSGVEKTVGGLEFHPLRDTMQNLMDLDGFESWWAENGGTWKATLDLSEKQESEGYMIFALYQQYKGLNRVASGYAKTKSMGELAWSDIELFDQARKEVRKLKQASARIASQWLR